MAQTVNTLDAKTSLSKLVHDLENRGMQISSTMAWQAFVDAGYRLLPIRPKHALGVLARYSDAIMKAT